ncbi:MAG: imidazoleglycerol-phosphate dehydratase, partial [Chloroflexi bacterium]|nr:imidazoleglycerol-phosphate dehydratase [Chloroflexota bacterium]
MADRTGKYERTTGETDIRVTIGLDGTGQSSIDTGNGMFDHLLNQLSRHGLFDLSVSASGDSQLTGWHHTVEDTGIAVGRAFADAIGDGAGIRRMGHALVPLDEALSRVVIDISGRGYSTIDLGVTGVDIAGLPGDLVRHFLESFAAEARITLHATVMSGINAHHKVEATFKALAKALRDATEIDPRAGAQGPS